MLKRKIENEIRKWIAESKKALLVYGARQVGKTYIIRKVFREEKTDFVEINLLQTPEAAKAVSGYTSVDDLILKLSLLAEKKIVAGKTFIFLDEIQVCPEIMTVIKFLVDDGRYRFVTSGSLLGVELKNIKSAPVGYLQSLAMYPLCFEEFLQIFDLPKAVFERIGEAYDKKTPVDEITHKKMLEIFNLYLIVGGMPAAVDIYRKTNNIDDVISEHNAIIEQYKKDFTKYEEENKRLSITDVYEKIPAEINEKNKRFNVSALGKNARGDRIKDSFVWLTKAGVAISVFNVTEPKLPLKLNEKSTLFKLFLSDVGMLTTMYGKATKFKIVNGDKSINNGAVFENVVAQELFAKGFDLYYYSSKKFGELDFVVEYDETVLPIEVKSGKDYERHSAINNVLSVSDYDIPSAIVLSRSNVAVKGKTAYLPIYMLFCITRDPKFDSIIPLDNYRFE